MHYSQPLQSAVLHCAINIHLVDVDPLRIVELGCVCVFTLNRSFYPLTSSTPAARADSSSWRDTSSVVVQYVNLSRDTSAKAR